MLAEVCWKGQVTSRQYVSTSVAWWWLGWVPRAGAAVGTQRAPGSLAVPCNCISSMQLRGEMKRFWEWRWEIHQQLWCTPNALKSSTYPAWQEELGAVLHTQMIGEKLLLLKPQGIYRELNDWDSSLFTPCPISVYYNVIGGCTVRGRGCWNVLACSVQCKWCSSSLVLRCRYSM